MRVFITSRTECVLVAFDIHASPLEMSVCQRKTLNRIRSLLPALKTDRKPKRTGEVIAQLEAKLAEQQTALAALEAKVATAFLHIFAQIVSMNAHTKACSRLKSLNGAVQSAKRSPKDLFAPTKLRDHRL